MELANGQTPKVKIGKSKTGKWEIRIPDLAQPLEITTLDDAEPIARTFLDLSPTDPLDIALEYPDDLTVNGQRHSQLTKTLAAATSELDQLRPMLIAKLIKAGWTAQQIRQLLGISSTDYNKAAPKKRRRKTPKPATATPAP